MKKLLVMLMVGCVAGFAFADGPEQAEPVDVNVQPVKPEGTELPLVTVPQNLEEFEALIDGVFGEEFWQAPDGPPQPDPMGLGVKQIVTWDGVPIGPMLPVNATGSPVRAPAAITGPAFVGQGFGPMQGPLGLFFATSAALIPNYPPIVPDGTAETIRFRWVMGTDVFEPVDCAAYIYAYDGAGNVVPLWAMVLSNGTFWVLDNGTPTAYQPTRGIFGPVVWYQPGFPNEIAVDIELNTGRYTLWINQEEAIFPSGQDRFLPWPARPVNIGGFAPVSFATGTLAIDGLTESPLGLGDMDCSGWVNSGDVDGYDAARIGCWYYNPQYWWCSCAHADMNGDGFIANNPDHDIFYGMISAHP